MKNNKAMTIIEALIAILLIALVSSAIMVLFPQVLLIGKKSYNTITAVNLAQKQLEHTLTLYHRDLHTLVETDTDPFGDNQFRRTTVVGYPITNLTANTITDSTQTWTNDEWIYYILTIASGTAKGNHYQISDNTGTTITCDGANFVTDGVTSGDYYYITLAPVEVTVDYKISIKIKITPFTKVGADIGLKDTPTGAEYVHDVTWKAVRLKTILVENE